MDCRGKDQTMTVGYGISPRAARFVELWETVVRQVYYGMTYRLLVFNHVVLEQYISYLLLVRRYEWRHTHCAFPCCQNATIHIVTQRLGVTSITLCLGIALRTGIATTAPAFCQPHQLLVNVYRLGIILIQEHQIAYSIKGKTANCDASRYSEVCRI